MVREYNFLGFDFGASSGRAMLGRFDGEKIELPSCTAFRTTR